MDLIKDSGYGKVWLADGFVYKQQPKFLMDNEVHALSIMRSYGYAPDFTRVELEILRMEILVNVPLQSPILFRQRCHLLLSDMEKEGLRHGDITTPHLFVTKGDFPMLIDWAESRTIGDPRPDKRPQGDQFWMTMTCEKIIEESLRDK